MPSRNLRTEKWIETLTFGSLDANQLDTKRINTGVHWVGDYDGASLDAKINSIFNSSEYTDHRGERIIIHPPDPDDAAATTSPSGTDPKWKWDSQLDMKESKLIIDARWAEITATSAINSFIRYGPDEKRENITLIGGFWYENGNLANAFHEVRGAGHIDFKDVYCSGSARDSVSAGFWLVSDHRISEATINGCEVTGATDALLCENGAETANESVFDLDVYDFRGGGGTNAVKLDGVETASLSAIQTGGAATQSITGDIVKLSNNDQPGINISISGVREENNDRAYGHGVDINDQSEGATANYDGIFVNGIQVGSNATGRANIDYSYIDDKDIRVVNDANSQVEWHNHATVGIFIDDQRYIAIRGPGASRTGDVDWSQAGQGPTVVTPDGNNRYRIRVDNNGNITTDAI